MFGTNGGEAGRQLQVRKPKASGSGGLGGTIGDRLGGRGGLGLGGGNGEGLGGGGGDG